MSDYQWIISPGGTVTAGGTNADQSVTVSWVAAGPQSVSVIYTTPDGCRAVEPKVKDITVNAAPSPVISGATLVPAGTTVEYSTPYIAGHSYSWSANIGNAHPCSLTNNCLRIQWYNPCGLISGVVSVTELDPVTGCSTTATVHVAFTN